VVVYGVDLLFAAIAYFVLERTAIRQQGRDGPLAQVVGRDWKGKTSLLLYLIGVTAALLLVPVLALALFAILAIIWLVPDRRMERYIARRRQTESSVGTGD
jgi:uncharacterized membrane protein